MLLIVSIFHFRSEKVPGNQRMLDEADKRGQLVRHLENALALADEIEDGETGFLIERALDEARSRQFRLTG